MHRCTVLPAERETIRCQLFYEVQFSIQLDFYLFPAVKKSSLSTLKRRLIPMSPLDRNKSGASLIKNASLDPMKTVQTLDKHVAAYYRNTKVISTGSGDEKINNTGGLVSFFLYRCTSIKLYHRMHFKEMIISRIKELF